MVIVIQIDFIHYIYAHAEKAGDVIVRKRNYFPAEIYA